MDNEFTVVLSAFESIKKFGWCNVGNSHKDAIEAIKSTVKQCGKSYTLHVDSVSTQIYVK